MMSNAQTLTALAHEETIFSTVVLDVEDASGNFLSCRALLDSASNVNFISSSLANRLGLELKEEKLSLRGINKTSILKHSVTTSISSKFGPVQKTLKFSVITKITDNIPSSNIEPHQVSVPSEYVLADEHYFKASPVDMLISSAVFYQSVLHQGIKLQSGAILLYSKFGWIVGGSIRIGNCFIVFSSFP